MLNPTHFIAVPTNMHSSLIPCRPMRQFLEFAGAHSSPAFRSGLCSSKVTHPPHRASANAAHLKYDPQPNFEEGQRILPSDDRLSLQNAAEYNLLAFGDVDHVSDNNDVHSSGPNTDLSTDGTHHSYSPRPPSGDNTGNAPAVRLHMKQKLYHAYSDGNEGFDDDVDKDRDAECMRHPNGSGGNLRKISRERTHKTSPMPLAFDTEQALNCIYTPQLHEKKKSSMQLADVLSSAVRLNNALRFDLDVTYEEDEAQDVQDDGRALEPPPSQPLGKSFNQLDFARVYNLVALQVSLAECGSLAYRLKGHLLNWPRISNISRVEGDDMDWDTNRSLENKTERIAEESMEDSLLRAVYGSIAPSGPLAERLNAAGNISSGRFRYLESLSRRGRKAMTKLETEQAVHTTTRKNPKKYYMVELVDCQDLNGLQKFDLGKKRWIGPFRLLLLDSKYVGQPASKLPMAIQMLLNKGGDGHRKWGPRRELVPCKLTLFYAYWSMEEILNHLLSQEQSMLLSIKIMGHIAVLHLRVQYFSMKYLIGKVVLDKHKPKVKTVINELEPVEDNYQPHFEVLAGNHSLVTTIVEDSIPFLVNLAKVYWDSDLACERQRLTEMFSKKDVVCDVFAGAGPLTLTAAKKVWRVFANDPNPEAMKYLAKNIVENKLQAKIELYNLDCRVFIRKLLAFQSPVLMSQIVFSLPTSGDTLQDIFKGAFDRQTWPAAKPLPTVHAYGYSDATNVEQDFYNAIVYKLGLMAEAVEVYRVKQVKAGRWLICASFQLPKGLAFDFEEPGS